MIKDFFKAWALVFVVHLVWWVLDIRRFWDTCNFFSSSMGACPVDNDPLFTGVLLGPIVGFGWVLWKRFQSNRFSLSSRPIRMPGLAFLKDFLTAFVVMFVIHFGYWYLVNWPLPDCWRFEDIPCPTVSKNELGLVAVYVSPVAGLVWALWGWWMRRQNA